MEFRGRRHLTDDEELGYNPYHPFRNQQHAMEYGWDMTENARLDHAHYQHTGEMTTIGFLCNTLKNLMCCRRRREPDA
jgi:hypothetical protein